MGTVTLKWVDSLLMVGADSNGRSVTIGWQRDKEPEWTGLKPSDLLLLAAASCSTYDIVTILTKQREPLQGLEVTCSGEQQPDPPYQFTSIHLHYAFKGPVDPQKVERAIQLSEDKYCSVTNTLRSAVTITHDFEVQQ
jgi:putative redox protein